MVNTIVSLIYDLDENVWELRSMPAQNAAKFCLFMRIPTNPQFSGKIVLTFKTDGQFLAGIPLISPYQAAVKSCEQSA